MDTLHNAWPASRSRWVRVAVLAAGSVLLHALALGWLDRSMRTTTFEKRPDASVVTMLLAPEPAPRPITSTPHPTPKPAPAPVRPASPRHAPVAPPAVLPAPAQSDSHAITVETNIAVAPEPPAPRSGDETATAGASAASPPVADRALAATAVPPPARVRYDAEGHQSGRTYYGSGELQFSLGPDGYRLDQSASVDIFMFSVNVIGSTSTGAITAAGLAPARYVEQVRNRDAVATIFNREPDKKSITFSSSADTAPLSDGAQDRVSVVLQLATWLRSNPGKVKAGDAFEFALAGLRSVDAWTVEVVGEERLDTPMGALDTMHLRRVPPAESFDRRFDIWLAPSIEWYPAKIVYVEKNGNTVDLAIRAFEPTGSHQAAAH